VKLHLLAVQQPLRCMKNPADGTIIYDGPMDYFLNCGT
jgi:hypothetical protein